MPTQLICNVFAVQVTWNVRRTRSLAWTIPDAWTPRTGATAECTVTTRVTRASATAKNALTKTNCATDTTTVRAAKTNWVVSVWWHRGDAFRFRVFNKIIITILGCSNETFSCGDWNVITQRSSCYERKSRCDFIKNCPNGRDEDECTLLSKRLEYPNQVRSDIKLYDILLFLYIIHRVDDEYLNGIRVLLEYL